jgi:hypothetical protein
MSQETKSCPECGESILAVARRCKHCHANLAEARVAIGSFRLSPQPDLATNPDWHDSWILRFWKDGARGKIFVVGMILLLWCIHHFFW